MQLFRIQPSLRQKITVGYSAIAVLIVAASLFTFEELRLIEEKILLSERISELFDTTLEIRRFERNYFLHGQAADYQENVRYVAHLRELLDKDSADFALLELPPRVAGLRRELDRYAALMSGYVQAQARDPARSALQEPDIRAVGKGIVAVAEEMAGTERRMVRSSLASLRTALVFSVVGVALLMIALGQALSRRVVHPLKLMEDSVDAVSSGKRDQLLLPSRDREIVSITNAFNHMLRELEVRQKHLLRSEKLASMGTMLSGVAHELNNPLSNIWSSSQILAEELETADLDTQRELLKQIDEQSVRARNIVRSLLDFARDRQFRKEPLPLRTLVQQTVRFIKGEIPAGVAVALDIPDDIVVFADKQRLQQAFLNLVKNAVEAVGKNGAVSIVARSHTALATGEEEAGDCRVEGPSVDITIKDSGPGIAPEVLPRIFDPFFTTKDVGHGMGLGLFIVYQIIEEHEGCISASSAAGAGTTFLVRLPLQQG
jgi:two-component system NtrC family sensor kinase